MSDHLHGLLDGELSDNETVDLLKSLIIDDEQRSLFRQQIQLHGALQRNETHNGLSASEEGEMLARISTAVGITTTRVSWMKRISRTAWGFVTVALLIGGGMGYAGNEAMRDKGTQPTDAAAPPALSPAPAPCNCDSAAAASATAVRDSVTRVGKETADATLRKPGVRSRQRSGPDDPTGSIAARKLARQKQARAQQIHPN